MSEGKSHFFNPVVLRNCEPRFPLKCSHATNFSHQYKLLYTFVLSIPRCVHLVGDDWITQRLTIWILTAQKDIAHNS